MPIVAPDALNGEFDVCVVGAGPAGLACAFVCHDRGLKVLVLDAGGERPVPGTPDILAAEISDANSHDPIEIIAAAALGGSSHWWGGRSVPFDPIDFREWPISREELLPWWRAAADLIGAGSVIERPAPGKFAKLEDFTAVTAESWAPTPPLHAHWRSRIRAKDGPAILLGARVVALQLGAGRISALEVATPAGRSSISTKRFVLACGGLGSLRLMLLAQRSRPTLFGGPDGLLGRGYMGHLTGSIADLVFGDRGDATAFATFRARNAYAARRRITPRAHAVESNGITNTAFWIENPAAGSAAHGCAAASARFLAGCGVRAIAGEWRGDVPELGPHFANIRNAPWSAAVGLTSAAWTLAASRITRQRYLTGPVLSSGDGGWRLAYHAEQRRDPANRISLSDQKDSLGLPKLRIDFRFSERDSAAVVRAHELLDADLRKSGAGELRWTADDPYAQVAALARDGYHQLGGAIMSVDPSDGVVDPDCKAHGLDNLWIASSCVFPTSGQANPTLTIIALACRVADNIASSAGRSETSVQSAPTPLREAC